MKRSFGLGLILLLSLLFLAGCGAKPVGSLSQTQGDLSATLSFDPDPPAMMTSELLTLALTDAAGQPVDGAEVTFDLTMPAMQMPPNQPAATSAGDGLYQAEATLTMSGGWQADAAVLLDGETVHFTFNFDVE